jgi:primosomal replication protein N
VEHSANCLTLYASIVEVKPLRYTPSGLPAIDFRIKHESTVIEEGQERQLNAEVKAVAFGQMAESIGKQSVGSAWRFVGFLATPRHGKTVVFHIQELNPN